MPKISDSTMANGSTFSKADFVIVTALEEEREAVLSKFRNSSKLDKELSDVLTYYRCEVKSQRKDGTTYDVIITTLSNMGPTAAATGAAAVLNRWQPKYVLLVGIACGIRGEAELGDILIANQVADYTLGKQENSRRRVRWSVTPCGPSLLDSAMNLSNNWRKKISLTRPTTGQSIIRKGVIASGGDVIADDDVVATYTDDWPKLVGIEMEAGGVAHALHQSPYRPEFLMIKGVSDFGKGKHDVNVLQWRTYACEAAASFAYGIVKSGPSAKVVEEVHVSDKKESERGAIERRWNHLLQVPLGGINVRLLLKAPVGIDWLQRILADTTITLSADESSFPLSRAISISPPANTREQSSRWETASCSFWQQYESDQSIWVRRIAPEATVPDVVAGFDTSIPWEHLGITSRTRLGELGPLTRIGMGLPPEVFKAGVEEFEVEFVGEQFSFSLCLSDHGLEMLQELANTRNQLAGTSDGMPWSFGTHFDGIQLLEIFREQLLPAGKEARKRKGSGFLGLAGPGGRTITFYPDGPKNFAQSEEAADYSFKFSAPNFDAERSRIRELLDIVAGEPSETDIYVELASRLARDGRVAEAIDILQRSLTTSAPTYEVHGLLGQLLRDLGRLKESIDWLQKGLRGCLENRIWDSLWA